uniref:Putative 8 1 7.9 kDa secreted protein n=1 Tax=Ixodes ricinus TaxID=34613 RepID=V5H9G5_IXORI
MRVSGILFLFAMCFLVSADDLLYTCTREWPVPFRQCLILCQHGEFTFRHLPTFTLEEKTNGTSCRTVPWSTCYVFCQDGTWILFIPPSISFEKKPNGTDCTQYLLLFKGTCINGECVRS